MQGTRAEARVKWHVAFKKGEWRESAHPYMHKSTCTVFEWAWLERCKRGQVRGVSHLRAHAVGSVYGGGWWNEATLTPCGRVNHHDDHHSGRWKATQAVAGANIACNKRMRQSTQAWLSLRDYRGQSG